MMPHYGQGESREVRAWSLLVVRDDAGLQLEAMRCGKRQRCSRIPKK